MSSIELGQALHRLHRRLSHDSPAPSDARRHAHPQSRAEHPARLPPIRFRLRQALRPVARSARTRTGPRVLAAPERRTRIERSHHLRCRCSAAVLVQGHLAPRLDLRRSACSQEAGQTACDPLSRGGHAVPGQHRQSEAPHFADDRLCGRPSNFGGDALAGARYRQPAHGAARRARQGLEGPVRDALTEASGDAARVLEERETSTLAGSPGIRPTRRSRPRPFRKYVAAPNAQGASPSL